MCFSDIIGQFVVKDWFWFMASGGCMFYVLLLFGFEGLGKLVMVMAFVQYVFCVNFNEFDVCGKCFSCIKVSKFVYFDFYFFYFIVGSKMISEVFLLQWWFVIVENFYFNVNEWLQYIGVENKQGNIIKEECVNIICKFSLKIFESIYKVFILWLLEYLGKEGNCLFKFIEELFECILFVLVVEWQEFILNIIFFCCQIVNVCVLSDEVIQQRLV